MLCELKRTDTGHAGHGRDDSCNAGVPDGDEEGIDCHHQAHYQARGAADGKFEKYGHPFQARLIAA